MDKHRDQTELLLNQLEAILPLSEQPDDFHKLNEKISKEFFKTHYYFIHSAELKSSLFTYLNLMHFYKNFIQHY